MKSTKAISLISSGMDSPVASYLMLKKGFELVFVHFDNRPLTDEAALNKTRKIVELLAKKFNKKFKFYIISHGVNQAEAIKNCERKYQCLICRRLMFRISERIAEKEEAKYLLTGENLAQVASQTLQNLDVNDKAVKITILRPLLSYNKQDTIKIAEEIGTFDISKEPGVCCRAVPKNPATKAKLARVESEEQRIEISKIVEKSIKEAKIETIG